MATFLDKEGEPISDDQIKELGSASKFATLGDERKRIWIDDMAFFEDTLRVNGFIGPKWPGGRVFYEFDRNVEDRFKPQFKVACNIWSSVANLQFKERTTHENYISIHTGAGNWSHVGMVGGRQEMEIRNWDNPFVIVHELGHALGLVHEQQRNDRDDYVNINIANIVFEERHNFDMLDTRKKFATYDFESIMHYGKYDFSANRLPTIEARPGYEEQEKLMGQRRYISSLDGRGMRWLYGD